MRRLLVLFLCLGVLLPGCIQQPTATLSFSTATNTSVVSTSVTPTPIPPTPTPTLDEFSAARLKMVSEDIEKEGITDALVLAAMRKVPRHLFVPSDQVRWAYEDNPLPIDFGQTISQPYIVALMSESLQIKPGARVLEIGTGSGYQAAILAEMGADVFSVEIIRGLYQEAVERLKNLGYSRIHLLNADGYYGWEEHAPYDAIIVTAAPDHLPQPLVNQLAEGGRLVIPIGPVTTTQTLWLFEKKNGDLSATNLGFVMFVPLTRNGSQQAGNDSRLSLRVILSAHFCENREKTKISP